MLRLENWTIPADANRARVNAGTPAGSTDGAGGVKVERAFGHRYVGPSTVASNGLSQARTLKLRRGISMGNCRRSLRITVLCFSWSFARRMSAAQCFSITITSQ